MTVVSTSDAPGAIGPYSQAVVANGFVFVSGQIPTDPATGAVVGDTVAEQTARVLANLGAVLRAAGASPRRVVSTTVYLRDMADFADMNSVYADFFGESRPARATVAVSGLPKAVRVEIACVALAPAPL